MLLPLRFVGEAMGITVGWEDLTRTVYVNQTYTVTINGEDVSGKVKIYQLKNEPYVEIETIAGKLGLDTRYQEENRMILDNYSENWEITPGKPLKVTQSSETTGLKSKKSGVVKQIDFKTVVPLRSLEDLTEGSVETDLKKREIHIERLRNVEGITVEDGVTVSIQTSAPVKPIDFTLVGPHRIVLDIPASVLSEEFLDSLGELEELKTDSDNSDIETGTKEEDSEQANDEMDSEDPEEPDQSEQVEENYEGQAGTGSTDEEDQKPASGIFVLPLPWEEEGPSNTEVKDTDSSSEEDKDVVDPEVKEQGVHEILDNLSPEEVIEKYPAIREIRFSQFEESPYIVRVVLELNRKSNYQIVSDENGLQIKLDPLPPKLGYLIVVDAGHGGKDPGAQGVSGNVEKDFNLDVAQRLVKLLKQYKEFQVVATRQDDTFLTLDERVQIANDMNADLFISIHANAYRPTSRGTETYYYHQRSKNLAHVIHRHLLNATGFPDRKVQTAPFYVIKHTDMPAVLTETGFMTNQYENQMMLKPEFRQKVAESLAAGIRDYYLNYE
ncbi:MAG: N-acetylmuramoyl-L-alanine amidase [Bacillaceae bacterium]|nr:N-acetylmuramoyl-L-alanine amidase [Bacillaceae bacterium]